MIPDLDSPIIVYAASLAEAGFIKGLLDGEDIPAFLVDEFMGGSFPWYVAPGGVGAVKVSVSKRDQERALELIRDIYSVTSDVSEQGPIEDE